MSILNDLKNLLSSDELPEFHKITLSDKELYVINRVLGKQSAVLDKWYRPNKSLGFYFMSRLVETVPKNVTVKRVRNEILIISPKKIAGASRIEDAAIKVMNLLESSNFGKRVNECISSGGLCS